MWRFAVKPKSLDHGCAIRNMDLRRFRREKQWSNFYRKCGAIGGADCPQIRGGSSRQVGFGVLIVEDCEAANCRIFKEFRFCDSPDRLSLASLAATNFAATYFGNKDLTNFGRGQKMGTKRKRKEKHRKNGNQRKKKETSKKKEENKTRKTKGNKQEKQEKQTSRNCGSGELKENLPERRRKERSSGRCNFGRSKGSGSRGSGERRCRAQELDFPQEDSHGQPEEHTVIQNRFEQMTVSS